MVASSTNLKQKRLIVSIFVICHFSYPLVVSTFHSRKLNLHVNWLSLKEILIPLLKNSLSETFLHFITNKIILVANTWDISSQNWNSTKFVQGRFEFVDTPYSLQNQP